MKNFQCLTCNNAFKINHCIKCYSDSIFEMAFNFINSNAWQLTYLPVINCLVTFICLSAECSGRAGRLTTASPVILSLGQPGQSLACGQAHLGFQARLWPRSTPVWPGSWCKGTSSSNVVSLSFVERVIHTFFQVSKPQLLKGATSLITHIEKMGKFFQLCHS